MVVQTRELHKLQLSESETSASRSLPAWRDPKRYLWLVAAAVPGLVVASWLLVALTGLGVFWWIGPVLAFGVIPVLDQMIRPDSSNPPEDVLEWLEGDRFYRCITYLYLPNQYGSVLLACWFWAGGVGSQ